MESSTSSRLKIYLPALGVLAGLVLAFLALFPDDIRRDWLEKARLIEAEQTTPASPATSGIIPVSAVTQATATPTPTVTPTATNTPSPMTNITLTIFRDRETFTLYVPPTGQAINLAGLAFEVTVSGARTTLRLDQDFSAFLDVPFDTLPTSICLRLERDGSDNVVPQECPANALITHRLAAGNVFWYDATTRQERSVLVLHNDIQVGLCGSGNPRCTVELSVQEAQEPQPTPTNTPITDEEAITPTPTDTPSPTSPPQQCGTIITQGDAMIINVVRAEPRDNAPLRDPIPVGLTVSIVDEREETDSKLWYRIAELDDRPLGWIPARNLQIISCP